MKLLLVGAILSGCPTAGGVQSLARPEEPGRLFVVDPLSGEAPYIKLDQVPSARPPLVKALNADVWSAELTLAEVDGVGMGDRFRVVDFRGSVTECRVDGFSLVSRGITDFEDAPCGPEEVWARLDCDGAQMSGLAVRKETHLPAVFPGGGAVDPAIVAEATRQLEGSAAWLRWKQDAPPGEALHEEVSVTSFEGAERRFLAVVGGLYTGHADVMCGGEDFAAEVVGVLEVGLDGSLAPVVPFREGGWGTTIQGLVDVDHDGRPETWESDSFAGRSGLFSPDGYELVGFDHPECYCRHYDLR
jgi:hypothetical protein